MAGLTMSDAERRRQRRRDGQSLAWREVAERPARAPPARKPVVNDVP